MKQNERILVYLVTGFLAVILMVAVFFGRDSNAANQQRTGSNPVRGLGDILNQKPVGEAGGGAAAPGPEAVDPGPGGARTPEPEVARPPLVASTPLTATEQVAQNLGASRRDRDFRIVTVRAGDSFESLVRRWCGAGKPFLEEVKALNESLTLLHPGQEVVVPWVPDEDVWAAYEARQPKLLAGPDGVEPSPAVQQGGPTFQVPGPGAGPGTGADPVAAPAAGTRTHVVKAGESYWRIAADLYGKGSADRMVKEIRRLNPSAGDVLKVDQKLVVPAQ